MRGFLRSFQLFWRGTTLLELKGSLDDPDCGVDIIAKPPGKKMQNINLMSGGENDDS